MAKDKMNMLNATVADQMLQNVFDICDVDANTVPLQELESYSNYRKDKFLIRKILIIVIMVLFLLLPVLFEAPRIMSVKQLDETDPAYSLSIETLLPIISVKATMDGENIPVYERAAREYTIEPNHEGEMIVTVTALNHQYEQKKIKVTNLDKEAPSVVDSSEKDGKIIIHLSDSGSGVNWSGIYAVDSTSATVKPLSFDAKHGTVTFQKPKNSLNIFVPDLSGNTLQLLLTV